MNGIECFETTRFTLCDGEEKAFELAMVPTPYGRGFRIRRREWPSFLTGPNYLILMDGISYGFSFQLGDDPVSGLIAQSARKPNPAWSPSERLAAALAQVDDLDRRQQDHVDRIVSSYAYSGCVRIPRVGNEDIADAMAFELSAVFERYGVDPAMQNLVVCTRKGRI